MVKPLTLCGICHRDPHTMNNCRSECSHIDCTYRRLSRTQSETHAPARDEAGEPLDALFDPLEE